MSRLGLVAAVVAAALLAGAASDDAVARAKRPTRIVRMKAADAEAESPAVGRMRFQTRDGDTFMAATFMHLAADTTHTLHWDVAGQDDVTFVTDDHGRAKLRRTDVPDGAGSGIPQVSVLDENGETVLECDAESMPQMHDPLPVDPPVDPAAEPPVEPPVDHGTVGGMMNGMCSMACMAHCMNGGTCDAQCHEDHGCTDACCCKGGAMGGSGSSGGGGMMGGSGSSGGGMMGSGGMMMK